MRDPGIRQDCAPSCLHGWRLCDALRLEVVTGDLLGLAQRALDAQVDSVQVRCTDLCSQLRVSYDRLASYGGQHRVRCYAH